MPASSSRPEDDTTRQEGPELYVGLMSGTSIDGVDGVLAEFRGGTPLTVSTLAFASSGFPPALRDELTRLQASGSDELERAARASKALADAYAEVIEALVAQWRSRNTGRRPPVRAVGAHGQTVRHRPAQGYTIQLLAGAQLAERCGYDVICDFRSADVAAGGQGAPLVPAFHRGVFASATARRAIINIGGIANVSLLAPGEPVRGFDTGPGNTLLDSWTRLHRGQPYDDAGHWAAQGTVDRPLLDRLMRDPYFAQPAPKSTHRDYFTVDWLGSRAGLSPGAAPAGRGPDPGLAAQDVQATLAELTAATIADAIKAFGADEAYVCGGGARNADLMRRLGRLVSPVPLAATTALGIDPQSVEALAFAWLARQRVHGRPGNEVGATGAAGPRVLGAWYPAPGGTQEPV